MSLLILNLENNQKFTKTFSSPYLAEQFKRKAKYSKKIKVIGEFAHGTY
jgi:hypothetical protein